MTTIRLLAIVLLSSAISVAQSTCAKLVPQALESYGCLATLRAFPEQTAQQFTAQVSAQQSMPEDVKAKLLDVVTKSTNAERLIKNVEDVIISTCDADEMKIVVDQLNTPLVQKMVKFESASSDPALAAKLQTVMSSPEVQSPPEKRSVLVKRLINTTGAVDAAVDTAVETSRGLMAGMGGPPPSDQQIAQMRTQMEAGMSQNLSQMMLAMYHEATDEELEKYVTTLGTKPFRDFNESFAKAMAKGVGEESRQMGLGLKAYFEELKAKKEAEAAKEKPKQ